MSFIMPPLRSEVPKNWIRKLLTAHEVSLVGIDAGSADNAIANAAEMTLAVREDEAESVKEKIIAIINEYASEYAASTTDKSDVSIIRIPLHPKR